MEVDSGVAYTHRSDPASSFDGFSIRAYASNYRGRARIDRLAFVAEMILHRDGDAREAFDLALEELKRSTLDTNGYREMFDRTVGRHQRDEVGSEIDTNWILAADGKFASMRDALEEQLSKARASFVKDEIRQVRRSFADESKSYPLK